MNAKFADKLNELSKLTGRMVVYNEHNRIQDNKIETVHIVHTFVNTKIYNIESPIIQDSNLNIVEEKLEELIIKIKEGENNNE